MTHRLNSYYGGIFDRNNHLNSIQKEFIPKIDSLFKEFPDNYKPCFFSTGISGAGYLTSISVVDSTLLRDPMYVYIRKDDDRNTHGRRYEVFCREFNFNNYYIPIFIDDSITSGKTISTAYSKLLLLLENSSDIGFNLYSQLSPNIVDKNLKIKYVESLCYFYTVGHCSSQYDESIFYPL